MLVPLVVFSCDDLPFSGSLPEFQQLFPDELACAAYLEAIRLAPRRHGRYAGRVRLEVLPDRSAKSQVGFVEAVVEPGTQIVSDAWGAYNSLTLERYRHVPVPIRGNPALAEDYLPIVRSVFANLKSWLLGCHHGVSPQHLQPTSTSSPFGSTGASIRSIPSGHCSGLVVGLRGRPMRVCIQASGSILDAAVPWLLKRGTARHCLIAQAP